MTILGVDGGKFGAWARAASRQVMTASAGLAVALLLWAAGLALWSRLVAAQTRRDGGWQDRFDHVHRLGSSMPRGLAVIVCIAAATLIGAMAFGVWRHRTRRSGAVKAVAWAGGLAVAVFGFYSFGIPAFYERAMGGYPVTPALPAVVAAWVLGVAGTAAVLIAAARIPLLARGDLRALAVGAVVGVAAASLTTVVAVRAGDDSRFVDATTAAAVGVPSVPAALGQKRFTITVPEAYNEKGNPRFRAAAAGAGFVVRLEDKVTAYGADGAERWHYRRTGPGDVHVETVRVFDNGATVLVWLDGGEENAEESVVALDAVTGEQLWSGSGWHLYSTKGFAARPYLVYRDDQTWTRTDSRTGKPMWTVPAPHAGCPTEDIDTSHRLVSVSTCFEEQPARVWLTVLYPQTGETVWDHMVRKEAPDDRVLGYPSGSGSPLSNSGVVLRVSDPQGPVTKQYVNVVDQTITGLPRELAFADAPGPSDDFLGTAAVGRDERLVLFDAQGSERCSTVGGYAVAYTVVRGISFDTAHLTFDDTFVVHDIDRGNLVTLDSTTCAEVDRTPADGVEGLLPAPGANLVFRRGANRTLTIDGYR